MDTHTVIAPTEDQRSGWTISVTTGKRWALQSMRLHNLLRTGQDACRNTTLYELPARSDQRHCCHGNKSTVVKSNEGKSAYFSQRTQVESFCVCNFSLLD